VDSFEFKAIPMTKNTQRFIGFLLLSMFQVSPIFASSSDSDDFIEKNTHVSLNSNIVLDEKEQGISDSYEKPIPATVTFTTIPELLLHTLNFLDLKNLVAINCVSTIWNHCTGQTIERKTTETSLSSFPHLHGILDTFFTDLKDRNESKMSLFVLNKILQSNLDFFPNVSGMSQHKTIEYRMEYTLGFFSSKSVFADDFIFDTSDAYNTEKTKKQLVIFLSTLLKHSKNIDKIFLNSTYYNPIYEMDVELAGILGEGVGHSSLKELGLKGVNFFRVPNSLPVFLNEAANNKNLECIDLSREGYRYDSTVLNRLIENVPANLSFKLILPFDLDFNIDKTHPLNENMRENLKNHFGDNIEFK